MLIRVFGLMIFFAFVSLADAAERSWSGAPPDCWTEERNIHGGDFADSWKTNVVFKKLLGEKLKPGVYSPNKGYYFAAEDGRPNGAVTIFAEKKLSHSHRVLRAVWTIRGQVGQRETALYASLVGPDRRDGFDLRRRG